MGRIGSVRDRPSLGRVGLRRSPDRPVVNDRSLSNRLLYSWKSAFSLRSAPAELLKFCGASTAEGELNYAIAAAAT